MECFGHDLGDHSIKGKGRDLGFDWATSLREVVEWTVSTYKHSEAETKEMAHDIYGQIPPELLEVRKAGSA